MPYKDIESRRAVQRSHYARNKDSYNPGREIARKAYKLARAEIIERSRDQWVPPYMVRSICDNHVSRQYDIAEFERADQAQWIYDLALKWCLRGRQGWDEVGVLLGEAPFTSGELGDGWAKNEFTKRLPKGFTKSGKAELLILNITAKRMRTYGL